jgi:hypothetical protein
MNIIMPMAARECSILIVTADISIRLRIKGGGLGHEAEIMKANYYSNYEVRSKQNHHTCGMKDIYMRKIES